MLPVCYYGLKTIKILTGFALCIRQERSSVDFNQVLNLTCFTHAQVTSKSHRAHPYSIIKVLYYLSGVSVRILSRAITFLIDRKVGVRTPAKRIYVTMVGGS